MFFMLKLKEVKPVIAGLLVIIEQSIMITGSERAPTVINDEG